MACTSSDLPAVRLVDYAREGMSGCELRLKRRDDPGCWRLSVVDVGRDPIRVFGPGSRSGRW